MVECIGAYVVYFAFWVGFRVGTSAEEKIGVTGYLQEPSSRILKHRHEDFLPLCCDVFYPYTGAFSSFLEIFFKYRNTFYISAIIQNPLVFPFLCPFLVHLASKFPTKKLVSGLILFLIQKKFKMHDFVLISQEFAKSHPSDFFTFILVFVLKLFWVNIFATFSIGFKISIKFCNFWHPYIEFKKWWRGPNLAFRSFKTKFAKIGQKIKNFFKLWQRF
jgi:hypothetical protein